MAEATTERETAPDVRGPTTPVAAATLATGVIALALVLAGTLLIQIVFAVKGGALTPSCRAAGLAHFNPTAPIGKQGVLGAEGVCNIVEAIRSGGESFMLFGGLILGLAALIAGFGGYRRMDSKRRREECIAGAVLGIQAVLVGAFLLYFRSGVTIFRFTRNFLNFEILKHDVGGFVTGAKNTLLLALGGEFGGIVIGLILAMFVMSERRVVRAPARAYINFFRGTPLIWQLSFFYFGFTLGLGLHFFNTYKTALLVFSLNTGAYSSEVFRAGIQSIERGQMEAARGLGFSYLQAMRYAIVPQAVRRVIPPLLNEFVILIKDTSLIVILGLLLQQRDLFSVAEDGYSSSFNATFFVAAAMGYLVVTIPLIRLVNAVERKLRSGLVGLGAGAQ